MAEGPSRHGARPGRRAQCGDSNPGPFRDCLQFVDAATSGTRRVDLPRAVPATTPDARAGGMPREQDQGIKEAKMLKSGEFF